MPSGQRVYLGNLSDDARERDVERFFKGSGRLTEVALKNGYGFVEFVDPSSVATAPAASATESLPEDLRSLPYAAKHLS